MFFVFRFQQNMHRPLIKAGENNGSRETASRHRLSQETKWNKGTTNMGTPSSPPTAFFFPTQPLSISCSPSIPPLFSSALSPTALCFFPSLDMCAWGALSACWLPGYRSNWGVSRELLLSEAEPVHTALVLSPLVFVVHSSQHFNPLPQRELNFGFI